MHTPSGLGDNTRIEISGALTALLADVFALYLKTKNFHWHLSGPHFRDYHLMLDELADGWMGMTDLIAERVRKIGGPTLRSVGHVGRLQRLLDNDADFVTAKDMLAELESDNAQLIDIMRQVHEMSSEHWDVATTSLLEGWIDEAEGRVWVLLEANRA